VTETLFALGVGDKLVARPRTSRSTAPGERGARCREVRQRRGRSRRREDRRRQGRSRYRGRQLRTPADTVTKLRGLGIPVLVVYAPNVAGALGDISLIGKRLAMPTPPRRSPPRCRQPSTPSRPPSRRPCPSGLLRDREGYAPADGSFLAEMITDAAGTPITTGSTTKWDLSAEKLLRADRRSCSWPTSARSPTP